MAKIIGQSEGVLLETLTWCLRCATREQLQRIMAVRFSSTLAVAGVIRRLTQNEEIESRSTVVAFPEITKPLFTWSPRQSPPNFHALAWKLEKRWKAVRPRRAILCWATKKGAHRTGGVACFPERATQVEHDLGTAAVYTHLCQSQPPMAEGWVGEDILRRDYAPRERWLSKIPDAAIYQNEQLQYILEFGGQYSVNRLRRFHQHSQECRLSYILY